MIEGRFGHKGLCQLPKCPAIIVIDSATYLLTISLPDINKVGMNLYDIINSCVIAHQFTISISSTQLWPLQHPE